MFIFTRVHPNPTWMYLYKCKHTHSQENIVENVGLGAGLASLAFWGFLAAAVVAGVWDSIRKRDAQHETVRRMIESGQPLNQELLDKLISASSGGKRRLDRDIKLAALYILPVAAGMTAFAWIMGGYYPHAGPPLFGVAALLGCIGVGFWVASTIVARWYVDNDSSMKHL
jgi:hypothetical protein